jgi:hypothetical protein
VLVPVVLPERVTVSATLPDDAATEADEVIETVDDCCGAATTVTAAVALLIVVPLDGPDRVTEKLRSLVCELLFRIGMVIVLVVSLSANVSVPVVYV